MASTTAATTTTPATTATPHSTPAERAQPLKLSMQKKEALAAALDGVMAKWAPQLPGVAFGVTTAEGQVYASYAGNRVYGEPDQGPVDKDTTYQLYSMTKLVTSLAVLQAVESGLLSYDDPATLEKYAPELVKQPVLLSYSADAGPVFEDRRGDLTLRHLVTHTSGLVYWPFDAELGGYLASQRTPVMYAPQVADLEQPLRFQPGSKFGYGPGLDWAGVVLERATGQSLEQLYRERIFAPLGVSADTTFEHGPELVARWQRTVHRGPGAGLRLEAPMKPTSGALNQRKGGDGLWSTLSDYLAVCAGVLAASAPGGIVSPAAQRALFADALPRATTPEGLGHAHKDLAGFLSFVGAMDAPTPDEVGHSVAALVTRRDAPGKRRAGSAAWLGAARTEFCIDPAAGMAFAAMTQIERPVGGPYDTPEPFTAFVGEMEKTIYEVLHLA